MFVHEASTAQIQVKPVETQSGEPEASKIFSFQTAFKKEILIESLEYFWQGSEDTYQ